MNRKFCILPILFFLSFVRTSAVPVSNATVMPGTAATKSAVPVPDAAIDTRLTVAPDVSQHWPDHAAKGYELFDAGRYRAAQVELLKATGSDGATGHGGKMRIDYALAQCAAKLGDDNALELINSFMEQYPGSIYEGDMKFAAALCYFDKGLYVDALSRFSDVPQGDLSGVDRDEYLFKRGYSYFMLGDRRNAAICFRQVGRGDYEPHALYYVAYIDYAEGNYATAKRGFGKLAGDPAYGPIVPFYLLQIEFLEGNYEFVVSNGDALLEAARGERVTEISRIIAESWFHLSDYPKTLHYLDIYGRNGGTMGREELYITGYSQYMAGGGNVDAAIAALSQVVGPDDKLTQNAAYHMAGSYLEKGDKRSAMRSFAVAAGLDFDPAIREDAMFNYGKLQFELGGGVFNEAINILSQYIRSYPASPRVDQAREYLAAAYYNSKNYDAAYEAIKQISNPDNNIRTAFQKITYFRALEDYNRGDHAAAYRLLEESLQNRFNPKYTALTQFWMGEILYRRGDYDAASSMYRAYLAVSPQTEPEYRMALYNLGYIAFNRQNWSDARSQFERFLSFRGTAADYRADAYNRLGDADYARREFWKAIESYDAAAKLGTEERYYSQFQRAMMLGFVDRQQRKIESLDEIIAARRGDYVDDAMYELGRTYMSMERFRDAAAIMKRFVDTYPASDRYASGLSSLGLIYQNLGDNKTAIDYYKMLVDKAPSSLEAKDAMTALKGIYVDMNDVDEYFAYASRSGIETDLGAVARDSLAYAAAERAYFVSGDRRGAVASLSDYIDKYPRGAYRSNALYYLADVYQSNGQTGAAIDALSQLAAMHGNPFTVRGLEKLAPMLETAGRYGEAAGSYKQLSGVAANPQLVSKALEGYLRTAVESGDGDLIVTAAAEVESAEGASTETRREAMFQRAELLSRDGRSSEAHTIYVGLATESQTAVGAKSTLKVIEAHFAAKDMEAAEEAVLKFGEQNTTHTYELGKAFLILGDIYASRNDAFQARATYQSIVDGYTPVDDGIVAAARERLAGLK